MFILASNTSHSVADTTTSSDELVARIERIPVNRKTHIYPYRYQYLNVLRLLCCPAYRIHDAGTVVRLSCIG